MLRLRATPFASLFCSQHLSIFRSSVAGVADCVVVFVFGVLGSSAYLCQLCVDQRLTLGTRAGSSGAGSMTTPSRSAFDTCGSCRAQRSSRPRSMSLGGGSSGTMHSVQCRCWLTRAVPAWRVLKHSMLPSPAAAMGPGRGRSPCLALRLLCH